VSELQPVSRSIPDGRELLEALVEAFRSGAGWVLASGSVEDVELKFAADNGTDARRSFPGRYTIVGLSGPLGGPYGATLSRWDGERVEIVAGVVLRARCVGVHALHVDTKPELLAEKSEDPVKESILAAAVAATPASPPGFAARAARVAHALRAAENEPDDSGEPEQGDHVQHFAFGLCEVLTASGDRLVIRDLSRAGRIREISTDMLVIHAPTEIDGQRVFRLTRRG
jgi:hypothetical protein